MVKTPKKDLQDNTTKKSKSILIDASDRVDTNEEVMRIELRGMRNPVIGKTKTYDKKIINPDYLIGFLKIGELPMRGSIFRMPYHNVNGLLSFGTVDSQSPVTNVIRSEDKKYIYFATNTGEWRLELLDMGN